MADINLIKASAGSGKTHRLMEKFSEFVSTGSANPENLLATTFTVKAAANLKSEIRKKLIAIKRPDLAAKVFKGLIGTVNSVCGQLLAEYAIDAGFSPSLAVLPEENADAIFNAATDVVIQKYSEDIEEFARRLELNPTKQPEYGKQEDWRIDVKELVQKARANGIVPSQLDDMAKASCDSLVNIFTNTVDLSLDHIQALVESCAKMDPRGLQGDGLKFQKHASEFYRFPTWGKALALVKATQPSSAKYPTLAKLHATIQTLDIFASKQLYNDLCEMINRVFVCVKESMEAYSGFKQKMGLIDFTDQESEVLKLLETNNTFRNQLSQRIDRMMVDEFQDTSPIQLAIFLKLNQLCQNGSLWVGDPKQAIYGFRGTDPELMATCVQTLKSTETLKYSWRSKENLVHLSNQIFTKVFEKTPKDEIELAIPPERKTQATGGEIEAWNLPISGKMQSNPAALAKGIAELLDTGVKAKDIAILMREKSHAENLAKELAKWNIPTTVGTGKLLGTTEGALTMAGFRYALDKDDTIAMATLLALAGDNHDWPNMLNNARTASADDRTFLDGIRKTPLLEKLTTLEEESPIELLERVISILDLERKAKTMPFHEQRLANINELRRLCKAYMEAAESNHQTATSAGFLDELAQIDAKTASGIGDNCVTLITYHQSKGLEWPIVILGDLNTPLKVSIFGATVLQAPKFDMNNPLADRSLRYWPYPFGEKYFGKEATLLTEYLKAKLEQQLAHENAREEAKRLFYVGLTRARDKIIFAVNMKAPTQKDKKDNPAAKETPQINWIDELANTTILDFPLQEGTADWNVGGDAFTLTTKCIDTPTTITPRNADNVFDDTKLYKPSTTHAPARAVPSSLHETGGKATLLCDLPKLPHTVGNPPDYDQLGNVFHNYIALNPQKNQRAIAERIIANWEMQKYVTPDTVIAASENLYTWLAKQYPTGVISTEWPITYHDANGTLYQGYIDMLVELPEGYVIIDHKTGGAADPATFAASHIAQLKLYKDALQNATGKNTLTMIIHLPVMRKCFIIE